MAVKDLWHLTYPPADATPCGEHGKLVASDRHGRGKRWRVRWPNPAGKPATLTEHFDLKTDAERFNTKVLAEVQRGEYVERSRETVRDYAERWRAMQPHRPNTADNTRSRLERHVYPALGDRPIAAVRPSEIQAFVAGLDLSPGSVRTLMATVSAVFGAALRDRVIAHDPAAAVKLPGVARVKVVPLTVDQVEAIVAALPARYRALAVVAAGTGMRQGELFGMQVRDVDFLRRVVHVERQVQPSGVGPLKNQAAYRAIPVGKVVIDVLAAHLAAYPAGPGDFVFRTPAGDPLHRGRIKSPWQVARVKAGLPQVGMHDLRHFYASALIRAGRSVKEVSERLGHSNAAMTLNVYSHLWPDDDDGTRGAIDGLFNRREEGIA